MKLKGYRKGRRNISAGGEAVVLMCCFIGFEGGGLDSPELGEMVSKSGRERIVIKS